MKSRRVYYPRGYKVELKLNNKERAYMARCIYATRVVYNYALAERKEYYERTGKNILPNKQLKQFNATKYEKFPWLKDISASVVTYAFNCLNRGYDRFFWQMKHGKKAYLPKPKRLNTTGGAFALYGGISITNTHIKFPCIGWIRLKERGHLTTNTGRRLQGAVISERDGRWFVGIYIWRTRRIPASSNNAAIGVDLGVKSLATCSDGRIYDNPKIFQYGEKKLKCLRKELARRKEGGANWYKTIAKISKHWQKMVNVKRYNQHQVSNDIVHNPCPSVIVLEDLDTLSMLECGYLASILKDAGMGKLLWMIKYKAEWAGVETIMADRYYPSSKTCSACGNVKDELKLSARVYKCEVCGAEIDRDLNAAYNLVALAKE